MTDTRHWASTVYHKHHKALLRVSGVPEEKGNIPGEPDFTVSTWGNRGSHQRCKAPSQQTVAPSNAQDVEMGSSDRIQHSIGGTRIQHSIRGVPDPLLVGWDPIFLIWVESISGFLRVWVLPRFVAWKTFFTIFGALISGGYLAAWGITTQMHLRNPCRILEVFVLGLSSCVENAVTWHQVQLFWLNSRLLQTNEHCGYVMFSSGYPQIQHISRLPWLYISVTLTGILRAVLFY